MRRLLLTFLYAATILAAAFALDPPSVKVEPVILTSKTVVGQPIVMPKNPTVLATLMTFPPGSSIPVHKHLYPHYGYVLEGNLTVVNDETGRTAIFKKGDFIVEANDVWHHGLNRGNEAVRLLIVDHVPNGVATNVVLRNSK